MEITRARETDVHRVEEHEVLQLRGQILPLLRMQKLGGGGGRRERLFVVVITVGERKLGLAVDRVAGEDELVVKGIDDKLLATDLVSGASILGDGKVVLILNPNAVVERLSPRPRATADESPAPGARP